MIFRLQKRIVRDCKVIESCNGSSSFKSWYRNGARTFWHLFQYSLTSRSLEIPYNYQYALDLTDVRPSFFYRKIAAWPFDTCQDLSDSRNFFSMAAMRQFGVPRMDGLTFIETGSLKGKIVFWEKIRYSMGMTWFFSIQLEFVVWIQSFANNVEFSQSSDRILLKFS